MIQKTELKSLDPAVPATSTIPEFLVKMRQYTFFFFLSYFALGFWTCNRKTDGSKDCLEGKNDLPRVGEGTHSRQDPHELPLLAGLTFSFNNLLRIRKKQLGLMRVTPQAVQPAA